MILDNNQAKAVTTSRDKVLVIACAGSGKTRVLTERIRYLLTEKKEDPAGIVAITLTNQAADEIISRLQDVPGIEKVFIGTIHSMAYNILRYLGYNFKILTDELDYQLHVELINKYCHELTAKDYERYRTLLLSYKLGLISEGTLRSSLKPGLLDELNWIEGRGVHSEECPETIKTICTTRNIIQFDDLLRFVVSSGASLNINHLLIDEFQDIGSLEYEFIRKLDAKNLFFVGDDWQSIYSFRGSNLEIFLSLYKDEEYEKCILDTNYRSCQEIIDLSNRIISQSYPAIDKSVSCNIDDEGDISCISGYDINRFLGTIREEGNFKDWFVLTRSNKDLVHLSTILQSAGIPHTIFRREGMSGNDIRALMNMDTVKLMTIHASKGLESDNVILYGDYNLNVSRTCNRMKDEEIRVFYVAVTRARKRLVIVEKESYLRKMNLDNYKSTRSLELNVGPVVALSSSISNKEFNKVKKRITTYLDNKVGVEAMNLSDEEDIPDENGNYLLPTLDEDLSDFVL